VTCSVSGFVANPTTTSTAARGRAITAHRGGRLRRAWLDVSQLEFLIGSSTRWNDSTDRIPVTSRAMAVSRSPASSTKPKRMITGKCQRYSE